YFGDEFHGVPVEYVEQEEQKGTAHAIGRVSEAVDEGFLALNGDVLISEDIVERLVGVEENAMTVMRVENPSSYGVVDVEDGRITRIVEKPDDPPSNLANLGIYVFEPEVFDYIEATPESERGEIEITDTIQSMIDDGYVFEATEYDDNGTWLDIGRPWELLEANSAVLSNIDRRIDGEVEDGATVRGNVVVEQGARIRAGAYV
ncbi:MAG: sugar phosphate nucleotidyltransferase, partial [Halobacteria archaeon]|nr:sugar phosphate nucleotidyltransferase [Halobacteria archaeon]